MDPRRRRRAGSIACRMPRPKVESIRSGGPNKPYEVFGREYVPFTQDRAFRERGLASWYGRKFQGRPTASGEIYDMYAMTAAHPTLPIPSYARVRNPANGREIVVRVNDRGPFHPGRIIDLSYTAALKLDSAARRCAGRDRAHHVRGDPGRHLAPRSRTRDAVQLAATRASRDGAAGLRSLRTTRNGVNRSRRPASSPSATTDVMPVTAPSERTRAPSPPPSPSVDTGDRGRRGRSDRVAAVTAETPVADARAAAAALAPIAERSERAGLHEAGARLLGPARRVPRARRRGRLAAPRRRRARRPLAAARGLQRSGAVPPAGRVRMRAATTHAARPRASAPRSSWSR